ncbi:MAG: hypothetical protein HRU20_27945 [Pseudomonadales bacterium]|nr:hypothetical protein [Pseudomonadales bacterium]
MSITEKKYWIINTLGVNDSFVIDCIPKSCPKKYRYHECESLIDEHLEDASMGFSDNYDSGTQLYDFVANTIRMSIVSEKVKGVFEAFGVDGVEYLPFQLLDHNESPIVDRYFILNPLEMAHIIDMDKTEYTENPMEEGQIYVADKLVINDENVSNHYFRASQFMSKQFLTDELYQALLSEGVTGLSVKEAEGYKG